MQKQRLDPELKAALSIFLGTAAVRLGEDLWSRLSYWLCGNSQWPGSPFLLSYELYALSNSLLDSMQRTQGAISCLYWQKVCVEQTGMGQ